MKIGSLELPLVLRGGFPYNLAGARALFETLDAFVGIERFYFLVVCDPAPTLADSSSRKTVAHAKAFTPQLEETAAAIENGEPDFPNGLSAGESPMLGKPSGRSTR